MSGSVAVPQVTAMVISPWLPADGPLIVLRTSSEPGTGPYVFGELGARLGIRADCHVLWAAGGHHADGAGAAVGLLGDGAGEAGGDVVVGVRLRSRCAGGDRESGRGRPSQLTPMMIAPC